MQKRSRKKKSQKRCKNKQKLKNILNKNTENFTSTKLDWSIIQAEMRNKLGNDIYESWLKKIGFVEELKNYVLLSVSTRFIRDWITSRYLDQILQIIKIYKKDIKFLYKDKYVKTLNSIMK